MKISCILPAGLLLVAGCTATSPFATTAQRPVPIAAQVADASYGSQGTPTGSSPPSGALPRQQFSATGPNAYTQQSADSGNPFLASLRSTTASIGDAFKIKPKVIPATDPTSLASQPTEIGADLHFQAAQVYEGQQNIPAAISHFQKALNKAPQDTKILIGFGRLYDRQNKLQRAQGLYQQALEVEPQNCVALNALGICHAKAGNLDAAIAQLSLAAQLEPQNVRYKNNLANVLADAGRLEEAYTQLVSVHGEARAHYNLGYLLLLQGKRDLAQRELGFALQANPRMDQARRMLNSLAPVDGAPQEPATAGVAAPGRFSVSQPLPSPTVNPSAASLPAPGYPRSLPPL